MGIKERKCVIREPSILVDGQNEMIAISGFNLEAKFFFIPLISNIDISARWG